MEKFLFFSSLIMILAIVFFFFKRPLSEEVLPIPSILRVLSCKGNGLCQMLFLHLLVNHVIFVFSLLM